MQNNQLLAVWKNVVPAAERRQWRNTALFAPMQSARVSTTVSEKFGEFLVSRNTDFRFAAMFSMVARFVPKPGM